MIPSVAVVADSGCSVPAALAARWGLAIVPLYVTHGESSRREGADVTPEAVLDELRAGATLATSQPAPADFDAAYAEAAAAGAAHVVSVHIAGTMSGTVEVARAAAARASVPVSIVDTRSMAMGAGWAAIAAAQVASAGASPAEVRDVATRTAAASHVAFTVETLEYLRRSGRARGPVAALGEALGIRPVLEVAEGEVALHARMRTRARALAAVAEYAQRRMATMRRPALALSGLGVSEVVDEAARELENTDSLVTVVRTPLSAALAVHSGPGTFVVAVADLPDGVS